ncbi:BREX-2 system adenine-specific DNA-methyltransferase PglX [Micromonospora sp. HM5-17]|uniref:BREX-2 system adenine-specific DNA-methyltransferase PglX n=1 Tax=Micromonospora sp. HM5-17 TaxID=2487710 RepID=UPI000F4A2DB1|nr:BREX-2 system adenine-specific DNA-methyltransferase PglX [Micromonospora sp. HM5-17]ROT32612.1 BREX-2 system adenine-specific DNA-methyltransferase PglX [Micromonospora sp. HM5-17]
MIDRRALLRDLQGQVRRLEKDLVEQIGDSGEHYDRLRPEYDRAFRLKRTAATWQAWRDERVTQTAVAWVLGTVFVRFCEDNGLFGDACYLTGPNKERAVLAEESQDDFFRRHPEKTDRDWLLAAFEHIGQTQAGRLLFDPKHNPAYQIPISHDAAKALIAFWRRRDEAGTLIHDFTDPQWGTRFLGDLYQDLSEAARKRYALLQTPEFVEEFILDLTLKPAIDEFGHEGIRAIDPTCGSGHFLLGIFRRLMTEWKKREDLDRWEKVRLALESVHGVDINPFAVAIARFRLLLEAMREAGFTTFEEIRQYAFPIQVAIGDSLIKNRQATLFDHVDELAEFRYATEDLDDYPGILAEGRYHVVVGNPPYITPKDKELNELYRELYKDVCSGKYALSVPFAKRFFDLAKRPEPDGRGSGHVGQITANSFMKREFGRKLIERYFAEEVDLTHVIDTSGAYIPGHGTPTVILVGRKRKHDRADTIRAVLGVRGEPSAPENPHEGKVWQAIVDQYDKAGSESEWISVVDLPRQQLRTFPWSLSGGGADTLLTLIRDSASTTLSQMLHLIGFVSITAEDDAFFLDRASVIRNQIESSRPMVTGDAVRDYVCEPEIACIFPYDSALGAIESVGIPKSIKLLWLNRRRLQRRKRFGTIIENIPSLKWYEFGELYREKLKAPLSIAFAFVATHNQFVLDRGGSIFNRSAPVIKLPEGATEDDHLRLLGVLNSSIACFWLKQVSHDKGIRGEGGGFTSDDWERFYEFTGTKLQDFPLPKAYPLELARELDAAAQRLTAVSPAAIANQGVPTRERLAEARREWESTRGRMIALQEELDWQVYHHYGLLPEELTAPAESVPELKLGERAFEIVLARRVAAGQAETQWFERHGSTPITELPDHWPAEYRAVVERRIQVIEQNRYLALIERPECKRRWATEGWDRMLDQALKDWLLDRCERRELWYALDENGVPQPRPLSVAQLADELRQDADFVAVANLYDPGKELSALLAELVEPEHVPYLAALRYTDTGMAKRAGWENVWDLQRQEDAAPDEPTKRRIRERIPVPEKYKPTDFRKNSYWSKRGKLDVPKERFISYPQAGRDNDPTLLIGWAGWDHREQAQALATLIVQRDEESGWPSEKLTPLLAGLRELMPWVRQWHGEIDPELGYSPAEIYDGFLTERLNVHGLTDDDLAAWRPTTTGRGRRRS